MKIFDKANELLDRITYGDNGKPTPPKEPEKQNLVYERFFVSGFKYFEGYLAQFDPEINYKATVTRYPVNDGTSTPLTVFLNEHRVGFIMDEDEARVEYLLKYAYVIFLNIGKKQITFGMLPKKKD